MPLPRSTLCLRLSKYVVDALALRNGQLEDHWIFGTDGGVARARSTRTGNQAPRKFFGGRVWFWLCKKGLFRCFSFSHYHQGERVRWLKYAIETLPKIPTVYSTNNLVTCNWCDWLQAMVHQCLFIVTVVNCSHRWSGRWSVGVAWAWSLGHCRVRPGSSDALILAS